MMFSVTMLVLILCWLGAGNIWPKLQDNPHLYGSVFIILGLLAIAGTL